VPPSWTSGSFQRSPATYTVKSNETFSFFLDLYSFRSRLDLDLDAHAPPSSFFSSPSSLDTKGFLSPSSHEGIPAALQLTDRSLPLARKNGPKTDGEGDGGDGGGGDGGDGGGGDGGGGARSSPSPSPSPSSPWPPAPPSGATAVPGTLLLVNSRERFLALDRGAALAREAERVWRSAVAAAAAAVTAAGGGADGEGERSDGPDPTAGLARFLLVAHADLKAYKYDYWFAFPALKPPTPFLLSAAPAAAAAAAGAAAAAAAAGGAAAMQARPLAAAVGASAAEAVAAACEEYRRRDRERTGGGPPLAWTVELAPTAAAAAAAGEGRGESAACFPLRRLWSGGRGACPPSSSSSPSPSSSSVLLLAFADPGADPGHPGWTLRNALYAAATAAAAEPRSGGGGGGGGGGEEGGGDEREGLPPSRQREPLRCVCVRLRRGVVSADACLALDVDLGSAEVPPAAVGGEPSPPSSPAPPPRRRRVPAATGWEPNARGRPGPRSVDLSSALDPARLAADALALNLRLMRWRAAPRLDLGAISAARFLLLGAGTLGCAVARTLLGWGVTDITFVDSGVVSYSNPPRQSLFEHADCFSGGAGGGGGGGGGGGAGAEGAEGGGRPKAAAAAAALRRIFPGSRARGVRLSIPMPGHPLSGGVGGDGPSEDEDDVSRVSAAVAELDALVQRNDVVMLLTDTREARWLPALLCAAHAKICITAALGFDSYVVMRHGGPPPSAEEEAEEENAGEEEETEEGEGADEDERRRRRRRRDRRAKEKRNNRLGCYFCSDVVAPTDSTRDRALDQQCTVSRPGCAPLAGAIAAELAAAVLAHPLGVRAPPPRERRGGSDGGGGSPSSSDGEDLDLPLGEAAHMVRGRLGACFAQRAMVAEAFDGCTACSSRAVAAYVSRGAGFVLDALRDPRSLEALTGLDELHASAAAMAASSSSEGEGEEGGGKKEDEEWTEL